MGLQNIKITADCTKCMKCVKVCPADILYYLKEQKQIGVHHIEQCIVCGQCAAICPTEALQHSAFPAEKIHSFDRSDCASPEALLLLCKKRRSNRAFSDKPVPQHCIEQILEAGHCAPTARNGQEVRFTVITSEEKLRLVSDCTADIFKGLIRKTSRPLIKQMVKMLKPDIYKDLQALSKLMQAYDSGNDIIARKPKAIIVYHTPTDAAYGCGDSNLAYQNSSLMAESLGVSQFYMGFVCWANHADKQKRLNKALGIEGTIHAVMALGMPEFEFSNYVDRNKLVYTEL